MPGPGWPRSRSLAQTGKDEKSYRPPLTFLFGTGETGRGQLDRLIHWLKLLIVIPRYLYGSSHLPLSNIP